MATGFVVDQGYGTAHVSTWQAGEPKVSYWFGAKQIKEQQKPVATFRCERCGFLESYAN
ncbi:hypothetical protein [Sphingomonas gilva]|uniref:hypothetical protein n=1 Tax=Sphingomonas gilva TaxID=2305907 RepID=UPI0015FC03EC|nr:hypothetical protein [Sphingomonas gilva]